MALNPFPTSFPPSFKTAFQVTFKMVLFPSEGFCFHSFETPVAFTTVSVNQSCVSLCVNISTRKRVDSNPCGCSWVKHLPEWLPVSISINKNMKAPTGNYLVEEWDKTALKFKFKYINIF